MPAMVRRVAEGILRPEGTAQIELGVAFVGETEAAMKLNGPVAGKGKGLAGFGFRHSQRHFGVFSLIEQRRRVVDV